MVRRDARTPLYDAHFINYGYNKVEFIKELQTSGFFFYPLTGVFGFDAPHLEWWRSVLLMCRSKTAKSYNGNQEGRQRMQKFIKSFLQRLKQMPQVKTQPVCDREMALQVFPTLFSCVCC